MEAFIKNLGNYIFYSEKELNKINIKKVIASIKEKEGLTIILPQGEADDLKINYKNIYSWITYSLQTDLTEIGITASFSKLLADNKIPCNVIAGFYHDNIFIPKKLSGLALKILNSKHSSVLK